MDRLLGKELCVLAWAVEEMAMGDIPVAVRNWLAMRPEELWWLFKMAVMSGGTTSGKKSGWRAALPIAFCDSFVNVGCEL